MAKRESNIPNNTPSRPGLAPILLVLGLVGGGMFLVCGCGCGAWLLFLAANNPTPEQRDQRIKDEATQRWKAEDQQATSDQFRARAFLDFWLLLLEMKNLDEPYRLTSKAFQSRTTRQQFDEMLQARPYLKERDRNWSHGIDGKPGDMFMFILHSKRKGDTIYTNSTITIIREANAWRLDRIEDGPNR